MDYYLIPNQLNKDNNYIARIVVNGTYTKDEFINKMLEKRNILSRPDLEAAVAVIEETFVEIIKEGKGLNLPLLNLNYAMKGTFSTPDARLNTADHTLEINISAGALLTEAIPEIKLKRLSSPDFGPIIRRFTDGVSKTVNSLLTPGGIFEVTGERLRIDGTDSAVIGLYLRARNGTETKVNVLLRNEPNCLSGQLPADLPSGTYKLVVKTQVGANRKRLLKSLRVSASTFDITRK